MARLHGFTIDVYVSEAGIVCICNPDKDCDGGGHPPVVAMSPGQVDAVCELLVQAKAEAAEARVGRKGDES